MITFPDPSVTNTSSSIPQSGRLNTHQRPHLALLDKANNYFKTPQAPAPVITGRPQHNTWEAAEGSGTPPGAPPTKHTRHDEAVLRQMRLLKRTSVEVLPGYSSPMDCSTEQPKSKQRQDQNPGQQQQQHLDEAEAATSGRHEREHQELEIEVRVPGGPTLRTVNSDPHLVGLTSSHNQSPLTTEHNPMISMSGRDLNSPFLMQSDSNNSLIPTDGLTLGDIQRETTAMETGKEPFCLQNMST